MGDLANEAAKITMGLVVDRVGKEVQLAQNFQGDVQKLLDKLKSVKIILDNSDARADHNQDTNAMQPWLQVVQRIAYEAEDLFEILAYANARRGLVRGRKIPFSRRLQRFLRSPMSSTPFISRQIMAHWVGNLHDAIDEARHDIETITTLKAALMINSTARGGSSSCAADDCPDDPLDQIRGNVDTSIVIGREADEANLVSLLCHPSDNKELQVVAIFGMGGCGKTTIAKRVYENLQVKNTFTGRIWIRIKEYFNIEKTLNKMVEFLEQTKSGCSTEVAIQKLSKHLTGKKYLLVLDDIWKIHQGLWDVMRCLLQNVGGFGQSVILVTTRDVKVAESMNACPYHLQLLSDSDSWSLFKEMAFANSPAKEFLLLKDIAKRIAKKCKGNPLAIKNIAGSLRTRRKVYDWEAIERSDLWDLPKDKPGVLPSLKLSYNHLPHQSLKKCFSIMAAFPKGCTFTNNDLTGFWMAHGLLPSTLEKDSTAEDIGEEYFNALLSISFLLEYERDELGEVLVCTMHDLVHDLAVSIDGHECCILGASDKVRNTSDIRHLAILDNREQKDLWSSSILSNKQQLKNLRSLISWYELPLGLLKHAKYLRYLHLLGLGLEVIPESISSLKCLKLLDLSDNPITILPQSITELYNLQTLDVQRCNKLKQLPRELSNLVNLRHIHATQFLTVPSGIGQLTKLQTLPPIEMHNSNFEVTELKSLHYLRGKLTIRSLEFVRSKQQVETANIFKKSRIDKLELIWSSRREEHGNCSDICDDEVLDGLCPHPNLRSLTVKGYQGPRFPSWLMRMAIIEEFNTWRPFLFLIKIVLSNCKLCHTLPTLGQLPSLKILHIEAMQSLKQIGPELYCHGDIKNNHVASTSSAFGDKLVHFPALQELKLLDMPRLVQWSQPSGEVVIFPSLEKLNIRGCPHLMTAPDVFPSLKYLDVERISSDVPLHRIISTSCKLNYLTILMISEVEELEDLPEDLNECTSLVHLEISHCDKLACLAIAHVPALKKLKISNMPCLEQWSTAEKTAAYFPSLEELSICECPYLNIIPDVFPALKHLDIEGASSDFPLLMLISNNRKLNPLNTLRICNMLELTNLPEELAKCTSLQKLEILDCEKLTCLPEGLSKLVSLEVLIVSDCHNLAYVPNLQYISSLYELEVRHCVSLKCIPDGLEKCTSLKSLSFHGCINLSTYPDLAGLSHLNLLRMWGHPKMTSLPKWLNSLPHLHSLFIGMYDELQEFPDIIPLLKMNSLDTLGVIGWSKLQSLPEQLKCFTRLKGLSISFFNDLEVSPEWLGNLSSLQHLKFGHCRKLKHLPSLRVMRRLTNLELLMIENCPLLEESMKDNGPEKKKIAAKTLIDVNGQVFS